LLSHLQIKEHKKTPEQIASDITAQALQLTIYPTDSAWIQGWFHTRLITT
jgi:hypothetical protein